MLEGEVGRQDFDISDRGHGGLMYYQIDRGHGGLATKLTAVTAGSQSN